MQKIPTMFERDWNGDRSRVLNQVHPGCEWVVAGEGIATQKIDGTCCLIRDGALFKRQEIKQGQAIPTDFEESGFDDEPVAGGLASDWRWSGGQMAPRGFRQPSRQGRWNLRVGRSPHPEEPGEIRARHPRTAHSGNAWLFRQSAAQLRWAEGLSGRKGHRGDCLPSPRRTPREDQEARFRLEAIASRRDMTRAASRSSPVCSSGIPR